jgi:hypothetical protein
MGLSFDLKFNQNRFVYRRHGKPHRDDGPAAIWITGDQFWYQYGQYHRDDGPAVIYVGGSTYNFIRGDSVK